MRNTMGTYLFAFFDGYLALSDLIYSQREVPRLGLSKQGFALWPPVEPSLVHGSEIRLKSTVQICLDIARNRTLEVCFLFRRSGPLFSHIQRVVGESVGVTIAFPKLQNEDT